MDIRMRSHTRAIRVALVAIFALATLAVAWGFVNATASQRDGSDRGHTAVAAQLRDLEQSQLRALVDADTGVLDSLLVDDFVLVPPPGAPLSKDDYLAAIESGALDFEMFDPISPIDVSVYGSGAVLTYESDIRVTGPGVGTVHHQAWHTVVYEKTSGDWQVVRAQTTAVGGFPPPTP